MVRSGRERVHADTGRGKDEDRTSVSALLSAALQTLDLSTLDPQIVPAEGIMLACALPGADRAEQIASIVTVSAAGSPAFGLSNEAVRSLLTARRFDPWIRASGVITNSTHAERVMDDLFLQVCSFDRAKEPPGLASMHWGVAGCCREGVPDAVFDRGGPGTQGLIRLFAETPAEVVQRIIAISRGIAGR